MILAIKVAPKFCNFSFTVVVIMLNKKEKKNYRTDANMPIFYYLYSLILRSSLHEYWVFSDCNFTVFLLKVIVIIEKSGPIWDFVFFKHDTAILLIDIHGLHENKMI